VAARLTDKQKKEIIADYVELGSFNAAAKANSFLNFMINSFHNKFPINFYKLSLPQ